MSYFDFYGNTKYNSSVQTGKFSPLDVPSLEVWLDGADANSVVLSGSNVSQWNDKSGNSNNVVQGLGGNQALYSLGALNGKNVLTFDGVDDYLINSTLSNTLSGPVTTFSVFATNTQDGHLYDSIDSGGRIVLSMLPANLVMFRSALILGPVPGTSPQLISSIYNGSSSSMHKNGTLVASGDTGTSSITDLTIGSRFNLAAGCFFDGQIAEILMYNRDLSPTEFFNVNNYLLNKWAI